MQAQHKVLLLDDDPDCLELYREIFSALPSHPEIKTATSGARAIALLESEPFTLLISDLNLPKMDGLQVLTIVRRKFPQLRTAVLTSVADEQFRARGYALGIDLFLTKPQGRQEIQFLLDCIESLLGRDEMPGFRGVQHKSLVDIVQLECLSQSSSVLRVTHGPSEGRIWIQNGEVVDAIASELKGEDAFRTILSWKSGNFEILPPEQSRARTIHTSYQGLLLETAQALDEADASPENTSDVTSDSRHSTSRFGSLGQINGVEFAVEVNRDAKAPPSSWGADNPDGLAKWGQELSTQFTSLSESLQAGSFNTFIGVGPHQHFALIARAGKNLCVGFNRSLSNERIRETIKKIISVWAS